MRAVLSLIAVGGVALAAGALACTASADIDDYEAPPGEVRIPDAVPPDAAADAPLEAGPCSDCEYFPTACSPDVFCPNGPFDESDPSSFDSRTMINVIRGRSVSDVWAVGAVGGLAHFDGTSWTRIDLATQETMLGLWLPASSEVALGGLDHVFARGIAGPDGGAWPSPGDWAVHSVSWAGGKSPPKGTVAAAWSAPGADWFWCALDFGGLWRLRQSPSGGVEGGAGISDAVCQTFGCKFVYSIHGTSPSELWAVGENGATVRIKDADGASPTVKPFNSQTLRALRGVWEASASDAWSVGVGATIRHYTGDPLLWEIVSNVPTTVNLNAVWGFSSSDVWAVGDAGVVLHYDGTSWARVKVAALGRDRPKLTTVWGAAPGHVWIGGHGVILSLGGMP